MVSCELSQNRSQLTCFGHKCWARCTYSLDKHHDRWRHCSSMHGTL